MVLPRTTLLEPAQALCSAFAAAAPVDDLLSHFTTDPMPIAHEHGHPALAPFLGRTFNGLDGVGRYFDLLHEHLAFEHMRFDPEDEWLVDGESLAVFVRGRARFIWKATGEAWNETFCYRLGLAEDQDGRGLKVQEYRVWSDTGAAYLASQGQLRELEGRTRKETREVIAGTTGK
ncbi:hypothetical protein M432DRAFT_590047 [Thermoascus aurantiacus ATCC 26904]